MSLIDSSLDAIFPSEIEAESDMSEVAIFPLDISQATDSVEESDSCVSVRQPVSANSDTVTDDQYHRERNHVGNLLVSTCCDKDCLLHLTAYDVLTSREKISFFG